MRFNVVKAESIVQYIQQGQAIVKINHYHESAGAYHNSEYYHNSTDCH